MAFLRKFFVELIVVAIIVGWAVAKFPDLITPWIPWLCLAVVWHLVWELSREGVVARWLRQKRTTMVYLIAFLVGGTVSVAVVWSIRSGVEKLALTEERREHPDEASTDVQLSITCDSVALPMAYRGELWILNTLIQSGGLMKTTPPPKRPEGLWPEDGVHGLGYRCTVRNHGTQAAFGIEISMVVSNLELIRTGDAWTTGEAKETYTATVRIPQPLGQQGSSHFDFYVCSYYPDRPLSVTLPSTALINSDDPNKKRKVSVNVTSIAGNPFTVPPKQPNATAYLPTTPSRKRTDMSLPLVVRAHIYNDGTAEIRNMGNVAIKDIRVDCSSHTLDIDLLQLRSEDVDLKTPTVKQSSFASGPITISSNKLEPEDKGRLRPQEVRPFRPIPAN